MTALTCLPWRFANRLVCLAMAMGLCGPGIAGAAARITIVDGDAVVIDGDRALVPAEGLALGADAIVRTSQRNALLRIEWPDGSTIDLGPETHAVVEPGGFAARGGRPPALYLIRGWAKIGSPEGSNHAGMLTPRLDLTPARGVTLVRVSQGEQWLFAEAGAASLTERDAKPATALALRNGEVYLREGQAKGSVSPRPTPAQMQRVPRGLREKLPLRLAALKDRKVEAQSAAPPTYADLKEWLTAERPLRRHATRRFARLAREPAFRAALAANLAAHPEWEPVLYPERFDKSASAPR